MLADELGNPASTASPSNSGTACPETHTPTHTTYAKLVTPPSFSAECAVFPPGACVFSPSACFFLLVRGFWRRVGGFCVRCALFLSGWMLFPIRARFLPSGACILEPGALYFPFVGGFYIRWAFRCVSTTGVVSEGGTFGRFHDRMPDRARSRRAGSSAWVLTTGSGVSNQRCRS